MSHESTASVREPKTSWGHWKLNEDTFTLERVADGTQIRLDELSDSAPMLDWVFQTSLFMTEDTVDLLEALDDIVGLGHVANQKRRIDPWRVAAWNGYNVRPNSP